MTPAATSATRKAHVGRSSAFNRPESVNSPLSIVFIVLELASIEPVLALENLKENRVIMTESKQMRGRCRTMCVQAPNFTDITLK